MPVESTLTIVIPVYNEERYLDACLQSIAKQSVAPAGVIVVDNNCTDNSIKIARKYKFVRVVKEHEQGRAQARNAGFNAVTTEIIGRIDADVTLPPNWVEHIEVYYGSSRHDRKAWAGGPHFYNVRFARLVSWVYSFLVFKFNFMLTGTVGLWGSNMAIRREHWQLVRDSVHTTSGTHEDLDLAFHLHSVGVKPHYDRRVKVRAEMRRTLSNRDQLWNYLQWWPRTLKLHGYKTWVICWFFGGVVVYWASLFLIFSERMAVKLGKKPLHGPM